MYIFRLFNKSLCSKFELSFVFSFSYIVTTPTRSMPQMTITSLIIFISSQQVRRRSGVPGGCGCPRARTLSATVLNTQRSEVAGEFWSELIGENRNLGRTNRRTRQLLLALRPDGRRRASRRLRTTSGSWAEEGTCSPETHDELSQEQVIQRCSLHCLPCFQRKGRSCLLRGYAWSHCYQAMGRPVG